MSLIVAGPTDFFSQTEKMVPVETLQSIFEEPSNGSKATQNFPESSGGTMIPSSFSSDTRTAHTFELNNALTNISFERTSSFFWSSIQKKKAKLKYLIQLRKIKHYNTNKIINEICSIIN
jgi:hypothetical protein